MYERLPESTTSTNSNSNSNSNSNISKDIYIKFWSFVKLKQKEYDMLCEEYWAWHIDEKIQDCNNYVWSTWKKYKDYNLTIRNWIKRDGEKSNNPQKGRSDDQWVDWIVRTKNPTTHPSVKPEIKAILWEEETNRIYKIWESKHKWAPDIPYSY